MPDNADRTDERGPIPMFEPDFSKGGGLIPAVAQDFRTGEILMLAYVNAEAWAETLRSGRATYFSRSRNCLWQKGATSGHIQLIRNILVDCDQDAVIYQIEQVGGSACHTGHRSCFYRRLTADGHLEEINENPA